MLRAFKIVVSSVDNPGSFGVYIAESASKAKTMVFYGLLEAGYAGANYSWITSCRRAPKYDCFADKGPGCAAWRHIENGMAEEWRIDTEYGRDELKEFEE